MEKDIKCSECDKENPVAFRVSIMTKNGIDKSVKLVRANETTPKPLCIDCAETKFKKVSETLNRVDDINNFPSKTNSDKKTSSSNKKESILQDGYERGATKDQATNWRWVAYGKKWREGNPIESGYYWVWKKTWIKGKDEATLIHVSNTKDLKPDVGVMYMGPFKIPPGPEINE